MNIFDVTTRCMPEPGNNVARRDRSIWIDGARCLATSVIQIARARSNGLVLCLACGDVFVVGVVVVLPIRKEKQRDEAGSSELAWPRNSSWMLQRRRRPHRPGDRRPGWATGQLAWSAVGIEPAGIYGTH